jgi:hypothetical protein
MANANGSDDGGADAIARTAPARTLRPPRDDSIKPVVCLRRSDAVIRVRGPEETDDGAAGEPAATDGGEDGTSDGDWRFGGEAGPTPESADARAGAEGDSVDDSPGRSETTEPEAAGSGATEPGAAGGAETMEQSGAATGSSWSDRLVALLGYLLLFASGGLLVIVTLRLVQTALGPTSGSGTPVVHVLIAAVLAASFATVATLWLAPALVDAYRGLRG